MPTTRKTRAHMLSHPYASTSSPTNSVSSSTSSSSRISASSRSNISIGQSVSQPSQSRTRPRINTSIPPSISPSSSSSSASERPRSRGPRSNATRKGVGYGMSTHGLPLKRKFSGTLAPSILKADAAAEAKSAAQLQDQVERDRRNVVATYLIDAAIRTVTQIWHLVPQTQSQPQPHLPQLVNSILTPPQAYDQPSNLPNLPQANHQNLTPPVQYPLTPESLSPGTPPGSQSSPAEDDSTTGASQHPSESEFYPHPPPLHIPHLHEHLPPQPHSHDGNHPSGCVDRSSMRFFVHELVRRSRISSTVLEVALCYIVGAKPKIQEARLGGQIWDEEVWARINNATEATRPPTPPASQSPVDQGPLNSFIPQDPFPCPLLDPKRTFLAALVLAAKFTHDRGYSNKAWARASGLPGKEVSRCERTLGEALNWRLWVGKQRESEREKDPAVDVLRTEQDPLAMHLIRQAVGAEWSRRLGARPVPICVGGPLMIRQPARRLPTDNPDFLNGSYLVPRPFPIARHPSSVPAFAQPPQATYGTCTTSSSIGITSHETMPCEVDPPSWTLEDLLNLDAANDVKPLSEYTRASTSTVTAPAAGYPDIERAKPVLNKCSLTNGLLGEQSNRGDATMSVPEATQLGFLDADGLGGYLSSTAPMDLSTPALAKAFDHNTFDQASSSLMPDMEMLFQSLNGFIEPQSTSAIHPDSLRWSYGMCLATSSSSNAYSWEPAAQIVTSA